jgi:hypothetical protein
MPVTVALKLSVPPTLVDAMSGETATAIPWLAVTMMLAVAFLDGSATLVATTWNVPGSPGAT